MSLAAVLVDGDQCYEIEYGTPAWIASCEWARFHGLDPGWIPAGSTVVRDAANCRILFEEVACDGERKPENIIVFAGEVVTINRIEQGEAPPLPFPAEVTG